MTCFDIRFLQIYNNNLIDLKYHLFFPNKSFKISNASHMIHSHKSSVLSSYVFSGKGYHTIHFDKDIKHIANNYVELRITKDFFHSQGNFNIVDSYEPHLVSNVSEPTFTIVLWTLGDNDILKDDYNDPRSFYLEKNDLKQLMILTSCTRCRIKLIIITIKITIFRLYVILFNNLVIQILIF